MKKLIILIAILFAGIYSKAQNTKTDSDVGTINGNLSVSPLGATTYTIPIDLPEGRAGMTPDLALVYNSQSGDGIMGKGWTISGWSYIARSIETPYYTGGEPNVISFSDDQFTLDGKTLIEVEDLSNGVKEYRIENDAISKIISNNTYKKDQNHTNFTVYEKDGIIKTYGTIANSLQVSGVGTNNAIRYHLHETKDRNGNTIEYDYERPLDGASEFSGEIRIESIEYTSYNGSNPSYKIEFEYSDLGYDNRKTSYFHHGSEVYKYEISQKLDYIKVFSIGSASKTLLKTYTISYKDGGILSKPYLEKVQLVTPNSVLPPTLFEWDFNIGNENNTTYNYSTNFEEFNVPPPAKKAMVIGDYNGDGIDDIIENDDKELLFGDETIQLRMGKDLNAIEDELNGIINVNSFTADLNGDGIGELIIPSQDESSVEIITFNTINNNTSFNTVGTIENLDYTHLLAGDFNHDNLNDLLIYDDNNTISIYFGKQNLNNVLQNPVSITGQIDLENCVFRVMDSKGNGKSEIVTIDNTNTTIYEIVKNGDNYEFSSLTFSALNLNFTNLLGLNVGDFNGDGKDDLLLTKGSISNQQSYIYYSFGAGFHTHEEVFGLPTGFFNHYNITTDLNNDGYCDLLTASYVKNSNDEITVSYRKHFKLPNVKSGFETNLKTRSFYAGQDVDNFTLDLYRIGDISGNGEKDLIVSLTQMKKILGLKSIKESRQPSEIKRDVYVISDNELGTDVISTIINGQGVKNDIKTNVFRNELYSQTTYPIIKYPSTLFVTTEHITANDEGGEFPSTEYHYSGLQVHAKGKGIIGFQKTKKYNHQANTVTVTDYDVFEQNGKYFHPYPKTIETSSLNKNSKSEKGLLSRSSNTLNIKNTIQDNSFVYLPVVTESINTQRDLDGNFIKTTKTVQNLNDIDIYGNVLETYTYTDKSENPSDFKYETKIEKLYNDKDEDNWLVGRVTSSTQTKTVDGDIDNSHILEKTYDYYDVNESDEGGNEPWPALKSVTTIPNGSSEYATKTVYNKYDNYGNVLKKTAKAPNFTPQVDDRVTKYEYKTEDYYNGRFLTKQWKILDGVEYASTYSYDLKLGRKRSSTDAAGFTKLFEYDEFGNLEKTNYPDQHSEYSIVEWSDGMQHEPNHHKSAYCVTDKVSYTKDDGTQYIKVQSQTFFDKFDRKLRIVETGFNGEKIYQDLFYDNYNRLTEETPSYFSNQSYSYITKYGYDKLGRLEVVSSPIQEKIISYSGRETQTTDYFKEVTITKKKNALGEIKQISDPTGTINYLYYSSGQPKEIQSPSGTIKLKYNPQGNRKELNDPNAGTSVSIHNPFGELIKKTDANNNTFEMKYDKFGRIELKTSLTDGNVINYNYYTDPNPSPENNEAFGKLQSKISSNGTEYYYYYDDLHRIKEKKEVIDGYDYAHSYDYDEQGRISKYTYPNSFTITRNYQNGFLKSVKDVRNQTIYWEAVDRNQKGQLTEYNLGNGVNTTKLYDDFGFPTDIISVNSNNTVIQNLKYNFDIKTGNLSSRSNNLINKEETFSYDKTLKERLTSWRIKNGTGYELHYKNNGNIEAKSDVTNSQGRYYYSDNNNAVTKITEPLPEYEGFKQSIKYTPFNKVKRVNIPSTSSGKGVDPKWDVLSFEYGPDNKRKVMSESIMGVHDKKTIYAGGDFEKTIHNDGSTKSYNYVGASEGVFAIFVGRSSKHEEITPEYIHKDYLGSYETITDKDGSVIEHLSFDPWGKRRNPSDWSLSNIPNTFRFKRGFTGHEHLDKYGVINMNARLYDPALARFFSPDPLVQAPDYTQNFNRYSYAMNNPLKYTDPDGEFAHLIIGAAIGGISNWMANGAEFSWKGLGHFGVGAGAGALGAGLGAAAGSLAAGAGSFSMLAGSGLSVGGVLPGAAAGAAGGFSNGFVTGLGNSLIDGDKFGSALGKGFSIGANQALTGGFIGGISGGIRAKNYGGNLWSGRRPRLKLSGRLTFQNQIARSSLRNLNYITPRVDYSKMQYSVSFGSLKSNSVSFMDNAYSYQGLNEAHHSSRIYNLFQEPINLSSDDPWCSGFANKVFDDVGIEGTGDGWAKNWLNWGAEAPIENPKFGQVAIFSREGGGGHVGFVVGQDGDDIIILGGNQSHAVNTLGFDSANLLGLRWY
ncbi:MAG: TIGR02594 family protein [Bacteroidota bacterium]